VRALEVDNRLDWVLFLKSYLLSCGIKLRSVGYILMYAKASPQNQRPLRIP